MKNLLLLFILLISSSLAVGQTNITLSDASAIERIEDKKNRNTVSKQWKNASSGTTAGLNLIGKHKSTMLFSVGASTGTGFEQPLIPTSNEGHFFMSAAPAYTSYQTVYAFDEKTLKLKHVRHTPTKNLSVTNVAALKPIILNNGDVLYFFEDRVKEGREVTTSFMYAINDSEMKNLEQSEKVYKDMRQASIGARLMIPSSNHNYFATIRTTDAENIDYNVYDKNFKLLYKSSVTLPKHNKAGKTLTGALTVPFEYKVNLSNDGQSIHFYTMENDKKAHKVRMNVYSKGKESTELSKKMLELDELKFFVQKNSMSTVAPVYSLHFDQNNDLHIVGFSPTKEKTSVKYKNQVGTFMAYKLSFPDLKVISSNKMEFDNNLIADLADKNKRAFDKGSSELKFIDWEFDDNNEIKSFTLRYYIYMTTVDLVGGGMKTTITASGDIYLPVIGRNFGKPTTLIRSVPDGTKKYYTSFKDKSYLLAVKRNELQMFEVVGKEETLVKSFDIDEAFSIRAKIAENENTLFLRTTKGILAVEF